MKSKIKDKKYFDELLSQTEEKQLMKENIYKYCPYCSKPIEVVEGE